MDPSATDLASIRTIADACAFAGITDQIRDAVFEATGEI
jgi:hypothetical protein